MRHAAARFCRILGQSCLTQRAMAASSRSRARRSGRCTVQPIALRMRQICEGWWRTPVRRQITVWIRLQVHRSVSNPCASAPCSSARSILRRPRAVSLALRPGPVERRAARPPCCHAWYQRCVFWREVPSRWATSAWLVPCSNMRAARSRRRSIPLKSRGSLVGGWCAVVAAISPPLPQPGLLRGLWHTSVSPYSEKLLRSRDGSPPADRRARSDRRPAHRRARRRRRHDRLVLPSRLRLPKRVRGDPRPHARGRVADRAQGRRMDEQAALFPGHEHPDHTLPEPRRRRRAAGLHADRELAGPSAPFADPPGAVRPGKRGVRDRVRAALRLRPPAARAAPARARSDLRVPRVDARAGLATAVGADRGRGSDGVHPLSRESATFALVPSERGEAPPPFDERAAGVAFEDAVAYWRAWLGRSRYTGRWREIRSEEHTSE